MPTPLPADEVRQRRKEILEQVLSEGFHPPGQRNWKGASMAEASRRLGEPSSNISSWLRLEAREAAKGNKSWLPDFSLYRAPPPLPQITTQQIVRGLAQKNFAPDSQMANLLPDGHTSRGISMLRNAEGDVVQQWDKSKPEGRPASETVQLPDPKKILKVSTHTDATGQVTQQWVSESPADTQKEALWLAFADALKAELPKVEPVKGPDVAASDRLAAYPVGDHHFGMLAWARETRGTDYDLSIAERLLNGATANLVTRLPPASQAIIAFLGDLLHYDSFQAVTPAHRNLLDADSRYPKMVEVAVRSMRYMIDTALRHHARVHVIIEIGNHDLSSMVMLAQCFAHIYESEPRVTFDTSPSRFHYFEFGANLIGTHHGDGCKLAELPSIMASHQPEAWGRTKHRSWWTGHIHQRKTFDFPGCSVESFRVLPPADAWGAGRGYDPIRGMCGIGLHREYGETERYTVTPTMLLGRAA